MTIKLPHLTHNTPQIFFFFGWFCIHSFLKKQPHLWLSGQLRNVKILQISNRQKEAGKLCVTVSFDRFQNKWFDMFQFPNRWETPRCSEVTISRGLLFMRSLVQTFAKSPQLPENISSLQRNSGQVYQPIKLQGTYCSSCNFADVGKCSECMQIHRIDKH